MKNKLYLLFFLTLGIVWSSCKRNPDQPRWNTNILTPLVSSTLTINNLVADSLLQINADSTVSLVYKNPLYTFYLDSLFTIPDTTLPPTAYGLSSLSLGSQSINYIITLKQLLDSASLGFDTLLNGQQAVIPPIQAITPTSYQINADSIFQSMTLISGYMIIKITNGFPIPIDSVTFTLANQSDPTHPFVNHEFFVIPPFSTVWDTEDISGRTISGQMIATLKGVSSPGSNGNLVLLDMTEQLKINISTYDLVPSTATAKFPAQDLIRQTTLIPFKITNGVQLTEVIAKAGQVNVVATNYLQDTLFYTYVIPPARLNNVIFKVNGFIPPAPDVNHPTHDSNSYNLAGYTIDLKGINENSFNTLYFNIVGNIHASDSIQTLGTLDSLRLQTSFTGLVPYYAQGYLGQDTIEFGPSSVPVTLFNHITSGGFNVSDVKLSLSVDNGIGVNALVKIDTIQAVNTNTGASKLLNFHGVYQNPFPIARATQTGNNNDPVNIVNSTLSLDHSNSNDTALISVLPNKFNYGLKLFIDPNGNTSNYHDFIYQSTGINVSLNMEIPLNLKSNQLTLVDTSAFSIGNSTQAGNISSGNFFLDVTNGFPFTGNIQMYLLNQSGTVVDSIFSTTSFAAPPIGNGGIVRETKFTRLIIPISESKMQNVLSATKAIIKVSFSTSNGNQFIKIYSDYQFGLKLIGDFTYKVE